MNREITFRIWNGSQMEHKIMAGFLGAFYVQSIDEKDSASMSTFNTIYSENTPLMQFTGMQDKNGNMLYESDIVECGYGRGKIVFKSGCFMVEWIDDKEAYMEFLFSRKGTYARRDDDEFILIGNIYENKEFLNKQD